MRQFRKLAQLLSVTQITSIQRTEILTNNGLSGLSLANSWWTNSKRLFVLSPTGFWSKSEPLSKPTKHRNPQHRTRKWRRPLETEKVEMHTLCWCSGLSQDRIVLIGVGGGGWEQDLFEKEKTPFTFLNICFISAQHCGSMNSLNNFLSSCNISLHEIAMLELLFTLKMVRRQV